MADDEADAFPTLDAADMALIAELGVRRQVEVGEYLVREGDVSYDFFVLVSAEVDIVLSVDGDENAIARHGPGRFLGEQNMLSGLRAFVSARVVTSGEAIVVPRDRLRQLMATNPRLGDTILAAFIARRTLLLTGAAPAIRVIGSQFSPESLRVREFLTRTRVPHEWLDPDRDALVEDLLRQFDIAAVDLPVVIVSGTVLRRPTPGELASYLGLTVESLPGRCFDLVVVGGGPAGLAAAVYGASEGLRTLGVEMTAPGGQAGMSSRIENYLGFPMGVSGGELTQRAVIQAEKFGANLTAPCTAVSLRNHAGHLVVRLSDGSDVAGRAVIAATGAAYRRLDAARLGEFEENGVYYAATEIEARMCGTAPVVVVGGGNSAGQAAIFLSQGGCAVTLAIRGTDLGASMSRYLEQRIDADPGITVRTRTTVVALDGDQTLRALHLQGPDGETVVDCAGLFSFIGAEPSSGWLSGCAAVDERGFVLTDLSLTAEQLDDGWDALDRRPLPFETSHPGLFAVGDLRSGSTKRVAAAVGEGSSSVAATRPGRP
ncbi:MAG TPA: FAD-dependent oxidoreductase, partial [Acidimicrobiales bacterium]|nr:FAD-dependent oxidoreductase [Acidimicrobiales bacterium]